MDVRLLGQPFNEDAQMGRAIADALAAHEGGRLVAITAWGKRSGLARLGDAIRDFRTNGGTAEILLGLDEAGATWEGLRETLDLFDLSRVFHDPGQRTFHPKIYLVESDAQPTFLAVGSSNATKGGLFMNYEASLVATFDQGSPGGHELRQQFEDYYTNLLEAGPACQQLTANLLEDWQANPPVPIVHEGVWTKTTPAPGGGQANEGGGTPPPVFGTPIQGLAGAPPLPAGTPDQGDTDDLPLPPAGAPQVPATPTGPPVAPPPQAGGVAVARRWTKKLTGTDAQQPPGQNSNPTGNLRLTKAYHPIDWSDWFRTDLFATANWQPVTDNQGNPIELAPVDFHVVIGGNDLGWHNLTVDYGPHRESGQANHTTILHWGPLLPTLRATNHVGEYVALERLADGTYRLTITPTDPGFV